MEKQNFEVKFSLYDLFGIFISKLWIILLTLIVVGTGTYVYSKATYKPVYKSVSRIYILRQNDSYDDTAQGYAQNLNAALTTVNDCKLIVKTQTTMQKVVEATGVKYSSSQLLSNVSLTSTDDSRIIVITAKAYDADTAKLIADTVAEKGVERIKEVMGFDQANIMEEGNIPSSPSNTVYPTKMLILTLASAFLVYAFFIIRFLTNDNISEPEEITDYLGVTVLGILPNEDIASGQNKYRSYRAYYKYKKYSKAYKKHGDDMPDSSEKK